MRIKQYLLVVLLSAFCIPGKAQSNDTLFNNANVMKQMHRVADWQINYWNTQGFKKPEYNWTLAAAYTAFLS